MNGEALFLSFLQLAYSLAKQFVSWYEREVRHGKGQG